MPLSTRLALIYIAFFAVALLTLEFATYYAVRFTLIGGMDSELEVAAGVISKDFTSRNVSPSRYIEDGRLKVLLQTNVGTLQQTDLGAQIYDENGSIKLTTANIAEPLSVSATDLQAVFNGETLEKRTITVGQNKAREMLVPLKLIGEGPVFVLQLIRPMGDTDRALSALFWALLCGGTLVLVVAARGGIWITRTSLRSIDQITETAQSIVRAEDLSRRVPVPETQDELHRLSVTINDLLARLDTLFTTQRRFVADVSHELRTPLAAMQGNLDVLSRGAARDPELLAESLADMRSEVNRLIRMVNDLLLLARSESGFEIRRQPVELDTLLLEVHRELRSLAGQVQLRIGEEDQVTVCGDRDRIKQALLNLTVNAIQHTAPGGSVTLSLAHDGVNAILQVTDTGAGISAEHLPQIFNRFYRVDKARSRAGGGAGLGLAIVKWIAEAHGGDVQAQSTPGQGSTFMLRLPLTTPAEQEQRDHQLASTV